MLLWKHKNISALIYINDHCDPHITFDCPAMGWTARMTFSMVKPDISLKDVKPEKKKPAISLLNELANQLDARLDQCRMAWWTTKGGVLCIENKEVQRIATGRVLLDGPAPLGRIIAKSGLYVQKPTGIGYHVTASIQWSNGTVTNNEIVE